MPGGFKIASDSANNERDGIVIEDSKGNQFVWIPVKSENNYTKWDACVFFVNGGTIQETNDSTKYLPSGITNEREAVLKNKGFYIGRYELSDRKLCESR